MKHFLYLTLLLLLLATSIVLYNHGNQKEIQLNSHTEFIANVISHMAINKYNYLELLKEKIGLMNELETDSERSLYYEHLRTLINSIWIDDIHLYDLLRSINEDIMAVEKYHEQVSNFNYLLLFIIEEKDELKLKQASTILEKYNKEIYEELLDTNPLERYKSSSLSKVTLIFEKMVFEMED